MRTGRFFALSLALLPGFHLPGLQAQEVQVRPARNLAELQEQLSQHLSEPGLSEAAIGVKAVSLDTGRTLFERDAGKLLKPASNAKLYTGALALHRLGPDYRIRTSVYTREKPDATGTVRGNVLVYGRGDPSMSRRFHDEDPDKALEPLLQAFDKAGIRRIEGDLVGDDSYFNGPPLGSGWSWEDLQYAYGAEVSALSLDDNVVHLSCRPGAAVGDPLEIVASPATACLTVVNRTRTVSAGGLPSLRHHRPLGQKTVYLWGDLPADALEQTRAVAVHNPAAFFIERLRKALEERGIAVEGASRTFTWLEREVEPLDLDALIEVAFVESRPMGELVGMMMKPSQNLYAQLLLLQAGVKSGLGGRTEADGISDLRRFLNEMEINPGEVLLQEGAGLSHKNLVTPNATVNLLRQMARHPHGDIYAKSLPLAGMEGTLRPRMRDTAAERNVRAKTGTLWSVHALSGYVTSAAGERLAFSVMLNNYNHPDGRPQIDEIAIMLAEFAGRSDE